MNIPSFVALCLNVNRMCAPWICSIGTHNCKTKIYLNPQRKYYICKTTLQRNRSIHKHFIELAMQRQQWRASSGAAPRIEISLPDWSGCNVIGLHNCNITSSHENMNENYLNSLHPSWAGTMVINTWMIFTAHVLFSSSSAYHILR